MTFVPSSTTLSRALNLLNVRHLDARTRCAWLSLAVVSAVILWVGSTVEGRSGQGEQPGSTIADLERGEQLYMSICANCHGMEGDEIPNINLASGKFRRPYTDRELASVIRNGIPATPMVRTGLSEDQAASLVKYLRWASGAPNPPATPLVGRPASGKAVYDGKGACANCHQVQGVGGYLGPNLSNVGTTRRPIELEMSMTDPDADIRPGTSIARVTAGDGTVIVGRLLGQETDLVQLVTQDGRIRSFPRADLRHFEVQTNSGMRNYTGLLTAQEIADLVSYLQTLDAPAR